MVRQKCVFAPEGNKNTRKKQKQIIKELNQKKYKKNWHKTQITK